MEDRRNYPQRIPLAVAGHWVYLSFVDKVADLAFSVADPEIEDLLRTQ